MMARDEVMAGIRVDCALWDARGIPFANQVRLLAAKGLEIRSGAAGDDQNVPECPYCHATCGGRHGPLCPRGGGPGQLPSPPEPPWVLAIAERAVASARHDLRAAMILHNEDPADQELSRLRFGQLSQLLESGQVLAVRDGEKPEART
jgi:hypothetical protein